MNILKLPFNIENDKLSHTERFLHEVISTLQKNERPQETPTLRFFTAVRSHFADGCALVVNDDTGGSQNWTGDAQLTEWFGSEIALAKQEGRKGEPFVGYETTQGVSYLAMPMNTPQSEAVATYMVLWRVGRLFHSEDLVAIKLAMALYQGHYTFGHQAPNRENIALTAEASDSALREQRLKDALDAVPEIVTLCGEHGEVRWYNKAASECLAHTRVPVSEYKDISWLAHLVHVDDVHEVLPRIKIALDHTKSLQIFMRLPTASNSYRLFKCSWSPTTFSAGIHRDWVLLASDASGTPQQTGAEIRNQLETWGCVLGSLNEVNGSDGRGKIGELTTQIQIMGGMIADEMKLDQNENHLIPHFSKCCIEEVIDRAIKTYSSEFISRKMEVIVDVCPLVPRFIRTDEARLQQVIENLIVCGLETLDSTDMGINVMKKPAHTGAAVSLAAIFPEDSIVDKFSNAHLNLVVIEKLAKLLSGTVTTGRIGDGKLLITISLPLYDDPTAGKSEFETRQMSLHSITSYIRSLRSSRPIKVYSSVTNPALRTHYTGIFKCIPGIAVVESLLEEVKLNKHCINVLLLDSLAGPVASWALKQDLEALQRARFVLLANDNVEVNTRNLAYVTIPHPLLDNAVMRAVHEAIIRMSLAIVGTPTNIPGSSPRRASTENLAASCPMRIMVVEDSFMNLQTLGKLGYKYVLEAHDGQQGVDLLVQEYVSEDPIELIFMDMQMPVLDGCGASMKIREYIKTHPVEGRRNGPHIVAMTANSFTEDRQACLRSGMCCFAGKPVQWELLEQLLTDGYAALHGQRVCRCQAPSLLSW